jgi:hypothetical protein
LIEERPVTPELALPAASRPRARDGRRRSRWRCPARGKSRAADASRAWARTDPSAARRRNRSRGADRERLQRPHGDERGGRPHGVGVAGDRERGGTQPDEIERGDLQLDRRGGGVGFRAQRLCGREYSPTWSAPGDTVIPVPSRLASSAPRNCPEVECCARLGSVRLGAVAVSPRTLATVGVGVEVASIASASTRTSR